MENKWQVCIRECGILWSAVPFNTTHPDAAVDRCSPGHRASHRRRCRIRTVRITVILQARQPAPATRLAGNPRSARVSRAVSKARGAMSGSG
jgi:hypothetical protein